MNKKTILPVIIGTMLFISTGAFSQMRKTQGVMQRGPNDMPPPGDMMEGMHWEGGMFFGNTGFYKNRLGLTDEQVDKIGKINLDYKKKLLLIRESMQPKEIKLQRLLLEDEINLKDVRTVLKEISDLQVEMRMLWINQRLDIDKVLTPAQKSKLKNSAGGLMRLDPKEDQRY